MTGTNWSRELKSFATNLAGAGSREVRNVVGHTEWKAEIVRSPPLQKRRIQNFQTSAQRGIA